MILKYLRSKKSYMKEIEYWKKLYLEEREEAEMYFEFWQMKAEGVKLYHKALMTILQEYLFKIAGYSEGEN